MFIGTEPYPSGGNTKLEMFLPTSGNAYGDVALVDGYSLSVRCQSGSTIIGGSTNLWTTGKPCVDGDLLGPNICKNNMGYAATEGEVTDFFQEGLKNSNAYCIWKYCWVPSFNVADPISCHVSGGL